MEFIDCCYRSTQSPAPLSPGRWTTATTPTWRSLRMARTGNSSTRRRPPRPRPPSTLPSWTSPVTRICSGGKLLLEAGRKLKILVYDRSCHMARRQCLFTYCFDDCVCRWEFWPETLINSYIETVNSKAYALMHLIILISSISITTILEWRLVEG